MTVTAVQYGVGPIGSRIVESAINDGIKFIGAIDIDPEKIDRDLGKAAGLDQKLGVTVSDDAKGVLKKEPDVVFHATSSSIETVEPQLKEAMFAGADILSTCEELSYPWYDNSEVAEELNSVAVEYGVTCLGTGINPGFAMDALPALLSSTCQDINVVFVERIQDAAKRRPPLQEKIGAGTSIEIFETEIESEGGHVGLSESVAMLTDACGWELDGIQETMNPIISDEFAQSEHISVNPGEVAGIHQTARGIIQGQARIELDLQMYLGASDPHDSITIRGTPSISITNKNGFHGDVTTPAIVVNSVRSVRNAEPGLVTMLDIALPSYSCLCG